MAQYHQSRVCNAEKSVGEEIARLQYATRLFTGILKINCNNGYYFSLLSVYYKYIKYLYFFNFTAGIERSTHPDLCNVREWLKKTERALTGLFIFTFFCYYLFAL